MKKIILLLLTASFSFSFYAQTSQKTASELAAEAVKKASTDESIAFLSEEIPQLSVPKEKRAAWAFLASIQEQMGFFEKAKNSYVQAAGISAGDAENMPVKSNEQLVLDAVRCALSSGDYVTADNYLNSSVRNSKDEKIQCYIKLYSVWSGLCKAETKEDEEEPLALLKMYSTLSTMRYVQPSVLLTLWYITGESSYSDEIKSKFPSSVEALIIQGDAELLPSPFWFFVPKTGSAVPESGSISKKTVSVQTAKTPEKTEAEQKAEKAAASNPSKKNRLQLGLFSSEANAKSLVEELRGKKFDAYIEKETKKSGNTYYIVIVDEKDPNTADVLRSAGYECYIIN